MKVLFHDGDLKIEYGGLKGTGALFVTGKLEITGQADLATTALCAIVAKQGLVLKGSGKERSSVHGLVYSEGPVVVQDVTVIGSLVNGLSDTSASPPPMQLSNAAFVRDAAVFRLDLDLQFGSRSTIVDIRDGAALMVLPSATADPKSGFGPLRYLDPKTGGLRSDIEASKLQELIEKDLRDNALFVRPNGQSVSFSSLSQNEKDTLDRELKKKSLAFKSSLEDWMKQAVEHPPYKLTLDLNRFIKVQSRLKVVGRQISKIQ